MKKTKLFFSALLALTLLGGCSNTPSSTYEVITVPNGMKFQPKLASMVN